MNLRNLLFLITLTTLQTSNANSWNPDETTVFIKNCIKSANNTIDNYIKTKNPNSQTVERLHLARKHNGDVCECQQSELMKKWTVEELSNNIQKISRFIRTVTSKNGKCYIGNFTDNSFTNNNFTRP